MEKILPHKHPMILIDDVIGVDLEHKNLTAQVTINENMVSFDKVLNGVPSVAGIEFMAQTVACYSYFKNVEKEPQVGLLLGTRLYNTSLTCFPLGETFAINVSEVYEDKIAVFDCIIYDGSDKECASATVNVYQNETANKILAMAYITE